jgi:hypothetical protein
MATIFGVPESRVQMTLFVNENATAYQRDVDRKLSREHAQRQDIISGWRELGMRPTDRLGIRGRQRRDLLPGLLPAPCSTATAFGARLRGRQVQAQDERRQVPDIGLPRGARNVRPTSAPGTHPDMFWGHCIEGIGNETLHPSPPRGPAAWTGRGRGAIAGEPP